MDKVCPVCGESFTPVNGNQVYCSEHCYSEHRRQYNRERSLRLYYEDKGKYTTRVSEYRQRKAAAKRRLDDTVAAADAAGMTYGQYMLMQRKKAGEI